MAAKRRHWKEKDGRFWARLAIPLALRPFFDNKTQLTEPLGGDLREADRNHAAAVARLQAMIDAARAMQRIEVGEASPDKGFTAPFNDATDYELKAGTCHPDRSLRTCRHSALRAAPATPTGRKGRKAHGKTDDIRRSAQCRKAITKSKA